jgi:hypothetical protein
VAGAVVACCLPVDTHPVGAAMTVGPWPEGMAMGTAAKAEGRAGQAVVAVDPADSDCSDQDT